MSWFNVARIFRELITGENDPPSPPPVIRRKRKAEDKSYNEDDYDVSDDGKPKRMKRYRQLDYQRQDLFRHARDRDGGDGEEQEALYRSDTPPSRRRTRSMTSGPARRPPQPQSSKRHGTSARIITKNKEKLKQHDELLDDAERALLLFKDLQEVLLRSKDNLERIPRGDPEHAAIWLENLLYQLNATKDDLDGYHKATKLNNKQLHQQLDSKQGLSKSLSKPYEPQEPTPTPSSKPTVSGSKQRELENLAQAAMMMARQKEADNKAARAEAVRVEAAKAETARAEKEKLEKAAQSINFQDAGVSTNMWKDMSGSMLQARNHLRMAAEDPDYTYSDVELVSELDYLRKLMESFTAEYCAHGCKAGDMTERLRKAFLNMTPETTRIYCNVASGGPGGPGGWHQFFQDKEKMQAFALAVIGNVVVEQVLHHVAFGADEKLLDKLKGVQSRLRNHDGFVRNQATAEALLENLKNGEDSEDETVDKAHSMELTTHFQEHPLLEHAHGPAHRILHRSSLQRTTLRPQ
ncbi:unnamed protein product [Periconia digitata]|uniref:Uncharacterized protein n=1 Tax=Periconia digitata TaxID=1303443 RepID=A0A9W4UPQ1_9PLEO|nr:unnamed protein product [Periconia digitata]